MTDTNVTNFKVEKYCGACWEKRENMNTCSKCKTILYCSKTCQKKHWPTHRLTCNKEQRKEGMEAHKIAKVVNANEKFMDLMSMICGLYWQKRKPIVCLFLEKEFMVWECAIMSHQLESHEIDTTIEGTRTFAIICIKERDNIDTTNPLMVGIPEEVCKEKIGVFGGWKPHLPLAIKIGHDEIHVKNSHGGFKL